MEQLVSFSTRKPFGLVSTVWDGRLQFNAEEPLVLHLETFGKEQPVREVSVELLYEGINRYSGVGNVRVGPAHKWRKKIINITFTDAITLCFQRKDLLGFLRRIESVRGMYEKQLEDSLDDYIATFLKGDGEENLV